MAQILENYLVYAAYVGLATVAGFIWWFIYSDTGPKIPYSELVNILNTNLA